MINISPYMYPYKANNLYTCVMFTSLKLHSKSDQKVSLKSIGIGFSPFKFSPRSQKMCEMTAESCILNFRLKF